MIEATKLRYARRLRDASSASGGFRTVQEVFKTFATMAACATAAGTREAEYLSAIQGYEREDLDILCEAFALLVNEMEEHPYRDLLGPLYSEVGAKGDRDWRGEFHTPWSVCDFMAALSLGDVRDFSDEKREQPVEVLEPASGSGGMVLSFAQEMVNNRIPLSRARFECWDVAKVACDMAYVNLSLWAVPARIVWGNSLSQEVFASWRTPFYAPRLSETVHEAAEDPVTKSSNDPSSENGLEQSA